MVRIVIEKHIKRQPVWLLSVLATFPYDRKASYPNEDKGQMLSVILDHLVNFRYKRRNSWECLGLTHHILCSDNLIIVSSVNDVRYLTIHIIKE